LVNLIQKSVESEREMLPLRKEAMGQLCWPRFKIIIKQNGVFVMKEKIKSIKETHKVIQHLETLLLTDGYYKKQLANLVGTTPDKIESFMSDPIGANPHESWCYIESNVCLKFDIKQLDERRIWKWNKAIKIKSSNLLAFNSR